MKRFFRLILFLATLLSAGGNEAACQAVAEKLHDLQNHLVTRSFAELEKGDWARYDDGTIALYLGRKRTPQGMLYGIEFRGSKMPAVQVWYAIVDRQIRGQAGAVTFRTLDPRLIYLRIGSGRVIRLEGPALAMALQHMGPLNMILTPGQIMIPPNCSHETEVLPITGYRLAEGQFIDGVKIVDHTTGGWIIVSTKVPFGFVGDPGTTPHLVAYGHGGPAPRIDERARRSARAMPPIPYLPAGMR